MAREGFIKYQTPELLYFDPLQISNRILKAELRRTSKQWDPKCQLFAESVKLWRGQGTGETNIFQTKISTRLTKCVPTEFPQNKLISLHLRPSPPLNKCVQIKFTNVPIPHKHFASFWFGCSVIYVFCNLRVQQICKLGPIVVRTVVN